MIDCDCSVLSPATSVDANQGRVTLTVLDVDTKLALEANDGTFSPLLFLGTGPLL
jgi:hypothetical protein